MKQPMNKLDPKEMPALTFPKNMLYLACQLNVLPVKILMP